jgi:MFS family permease
VLLVASVLQAVVVAVLTTAGSGTSLVLLAAAGGLASPPISSVARGLWPDLVPQRDRLQRLFGVDATVQELVFIVGPALVAGAVAAVSPVAALWLVVVVGLAGNAALAASPLLARPPGRAAAAGIDLWRPMRRILAVSVLLAAAVGATEVAVPAVAIEAGQPAVAGVLLALFSVGSLFGGLGAASLPTQPPPLRQLRVCATACAVSTALLAAAASSGVPLTGVVVLLAGVTIAPALAGLYSVVERVVDPVRRTEAFALTVSAFLAGIAGGSAASGWLSEHVSPSAALLAAAPLPLLAVLVSSALLPQSAPAD